MLSGPGEFTLEQPLTRRQLMLRGGSAALAIGGAGVLAGSERLGAITGWITFSGAPDSASASSRARVEDSV
jgi:hypothetical protein